MFTPDTLGFLAYLSIWWGTREISHRKNGWLFRVAGDILWLSIGIYLNMWISITLWSAVFAYTDLRGYIRWRNEDKQC